MPITQKQRLARTKKLGSSDAPAILGVSPWKTATDVYWSKLAVSPDDHRSKSQQTGNRLEGALLEFAQEELGVRVQRNRYRVCRVAGRRMLAAHLDGLANGSREGVEAKYVGQSNAGDWGEPGTDEVPDYVIVQVQHGIYCAELDKMWVAAAVAGYSLDWRLYCVPRNEDLIAVIIERELAFWHDHVLARVPPTPGPPPLEVMQALRREPGSLVAIDDPLAATDIGFYQECLRIAGEHDDLCDRTKRRVLEWLGEAEGARLPDGTLITYLSQKSPPRCDLTRLRAEQLDIYNEYVTQGTHRVLRIKRPKGERPNESQDSLGGPAEPARITDGRVGSDDGSAEQPAHAGSAGGHDGGEAVP